MKLLFNQTQCNQIQFNGRFYHEGLSGDLRSLEGVDKLQSARGVEKLRNLEGTDRVQTKFKKLNLLQSKLGKKEAEKRKEESLITDDNVELFIEIQSMNAEELKVFIKNVVVDSWQLPTELEPYRNKQVLADAYFELFQKLKINLELSKQDAQDFLVKRVIPGN